MSRVCSLEGCGGTHEARGYCNAHYLRHKKGLPLDSPIREVGVPFWDRVDRSGGIDSCWLWTGARYGCSPYGHWWSPEARHDMATHRYVASLAYGALPVDAVVLHSCDEPACCNPLHLIVGTQRQNIRDMYQKGRGRQGAAHSGRKLTDDDVREVFASGGTNGEIAARFGISKTTVSHIKNRRVRRDALAVAQ